MPGTLRPAAPDTGCGRKNWIFGIALASGIAGGLFVPPMLATGLAHSPTGSAMQRVPTTFSAIPGWNDDRQSAALAVFRRSCPRAGRARSKAAQALRTVCAAADQLAPAIGDQQAREFFETHFQPMAIIARGHANGLFTGYFEPELDGALVPSKAFPIALRGAPKNLVSLAKVRDRQGLPATLTHALRVNGRLKIAPTRAQIEAGALGHAAAPVAWVGNAVDAFFLHIQGSGRLRLADGRHMRVTYAGKNGRPYTSIGKVLVETGQLAKARVSMQTIRAWMATNPDKAGALMNKNRSYIFFNLVANSTPGLGPPGQMGVPLTPGRSLAVDLAYHTPGLPVWLDTTVPGEPGENGGADRPFRRLMVAQDTGSAIRGAVRGDIFFGTGKAAGQRAGRMQAQGRIIVLQPR